MADSLPTAAYRDALAGEARHLRAGLEAWPVGPAADHARAACDGLAAEVAALPVAAADVTVPPFPDDEHSHQDDENKHVEHTAMLHLVPAAGCSHFAAFDGNASDPNTWRRLDNPNVAEVPGDGARVWVPAGRTVTQDADTARWQWLRVNGAYLQNPGVWLQNVTTVGAPGHVLRIRGGVRILGRGPRDVAYDPLDLSGGLIVHGPPDIQGETKTPWAVPAAVPTGDTLTFAAAPDGWRVGDRVLVTGCNPLDRDEVADEERTITAIDGGTVRLDSPLAHGNHGDLPGLPGAMPVANLTRSVVFENENPADPAHFMVMHSGGGVVAYAEFRGFGRTDATRIHTNGHGSDNQMGRYVVHHHVITGAPRTVAPLVIAGNVVRGSRKHGVVSHGGHARISGNVVLDCKGSGIFEENGLGIGPTFGNLVVGCVNPGFDQIDDNREATATAPRDFGGDGVGIWAQSGGMDVYENYVLRCGTGLETFPRELKGPADPSEVQAAALRDDERDAVSMGRPSVRVEQVPGRFLRNTVVGCGTGFSSWSNNLFSRFPDEPPFVGLPDDRPPTAAVPTRVEDNRFIGCRDGARTTYTRALAVRRNVFVNFPGGSPWAEPSTSAFRTNEAAEAFVIEGCRFSGYDSPPMLPGRGANVFRDNYVDCDHGGLYVQSPSQRPDGLVCAVTYDVAGNSWGPRTVRSGNLVYGPGAAGVAAQ
jgi:hypothetical protein